MSTIGKIGFGTMEYCDGAYPPESAYDAVKLALETGYRTFDTAEAYATVSHVGQALADSAIPREDLFVISKLKGGLPLGPYSAIKERVQKHLRDLQLSQLDLLLIHYPGPESLDFDGPASAVESSCSMDWFGQHIAEAWKNMTALQTDGLTRHIGVSNFYRGHFDSLQRLIEQDPSLALPFANEFFVDIAHQETDYVSHLQGLGVKVLAYRPIAYCPVYQMAQDMGDATWSTLDTVARSFSSTNVSPQQVVLAELCRRGIVALSKSSQKEHIEANWNAAGLPLQNELLQLGDETLQSLAGLDGNETVDMCGGFDEYAIAFKSLCA